MKKSLIVLIYIILSTFSTINKVVGQNIYSYAGIGISGFSGDGGLSSSAKISSSYGIAADHSGNIYFCDGQRIRKVNSAGIISTIAGTGVSGFSGDGGQASLAQLNNPNGITIDLLGNIYFSDLTNNRIRKINTNGIINTIAGIGSPGFSGDGGPATSAKIASVFGLVTDSVGNLYFGDVQNYRIRKINTTGIITTIAGTGVVGHTGDLGQATSAKIAEVECLAIDASGNIYFTEFSPYNSIRKINTSGIIKTIAGKIPGGFSGDGGIADSCQMYGPVGIAVDANGNIYFADSDNYRIRKINTSGIVTTIAGIGTANYSGDGGFATACEFNLPTYIAIDASNNIYVTDYWNNRIRVICTGNCLSGFNEINNILSSIKLYPNPANDILTLNLNDSQNDFNKVEIINSLGQIVKEKEFPLAEHPSMEKNYTIKTNELPNGVYILTVKNDNLSINKKFVIAK